MPRLYSFSKVPLRIRQPCTPGSLRSNYVSEPQRRGPIPCGALHGQRLGQTVQQLRPSTLNKPQLPPRKNHPVKVLFLPPFPVLPSLKTAFSSFDVLSPPRLEVFFFSVPRLDFITSRELQIQ
ncbi:hypothetical protein VTO42DRAFT_7697 [Malbranchea cinnamomea]